MTVVADPVDTLLGPNGAVVAPVAAPTFTRHGDDFLIQGGGADLLLTGLRDGSEGVHGELTVTCANERGELEEPSHWGRLNLASTAAREALVKKLATIKSDVPWRTLLETACRRTAMEIRRGSPTITLRPRLASGSRHLVDPLLPLNTVSVLFGDGGSGKGYVAVALALAVKCGASLPGGLVVPKATEVMYLDWESGPDDLEDRAYRIAQGLGCSGEGLHYRRMGRALADEAPALRAEISRLGVGFLIVDSLAPACGAEPEGADAAVRAYNAVRSLGRGVTTLVIAHMNKLMADQKAGAARPFGSVFVWNLARSVWELRKSAEEAGDDLVVSLYHRKVNAGRLRPPIALRFTFSDNTVSVTRADLADAPDLLARVSLFHQLRSALAQGPRTVEALAEQLDAAEGTIRKELHRHKTKGAFVALPDTKPQQWALGSKR